jgi:hypothetical protein
LMRNSLKKRLFAHLYSILVISCTFALVTKKNQPFYCSCVFFCKFARKVSLLNRYYIILDEVFFDNFLIIIYFSCMQKIIIIHSFWSTLIIYLLVVYQKNNNSFILVSGILLNTKGRILIRNLIFIIVINIREISI